MKKGVGADIHSKHVDTQLNMLSNAVILILTPIFQEIRYGKLFLCTETAIPVVTSHRWSMTDLHLTSAVPTTA